MITVEQYKKKLQQTLGFCSPILVKEYAEARKAWKEKIVAAKNSGFQYPNSNHTKCKDCADYCAGCSGKCNIAKVNVSRLDKCPNDKWG